MSRDSKHTSHSSNGSSSNNSIKVTLVATFALVLILSNIASIKIFEVAGGLAVLDGGAIVFPLTYILSDTIAECFGFKVARFSIILAFCLNILAALVFFVLQQLPPAAGWEHQAAFESVLGFFPRILAGSLVAFVAGQLLNAGILVKLKNITHGRWLWMRTLGSSVVADALDTLLFTFIAFYGVIEGSAWGVLLISAFLTKIIGEIILTPVTYLTVHFVKKSLGSDHFDKNFSWEQLILHIPDRYS